MYINKKAQIGMASIVLVVLLGVSFVAGSRQERAQVSRPVTETVLSPAQMADSAEGEAILLNRKNLAPNSEKVTEAANPEQTEIPLHLVDAKLQSSSTINARVGENLKLAITCEEMDDEYDVSIIALAQRATCSNNSNNHLEFTPGVSGTFPIELQPEDGDRIKIGELVVQ